MENNLGLLLLQAFLWFDDGLLQAMRVEGLPGMSRSQSLLYAHLEAGSSRPSELARQMGVTRQAVHRLVHEMEDAGLVELRPDLRDRRATTVALTEKGKRNVEQARLVLMQLEEVLSDRIGSDRVAGLREALETDWGAPPDIESDGADPGRATL